MKYLFLSGGVASGFALLGYLAKSQVLLAKPAIIILAATMIAIALSLIFVRTLSEVLGWDLSATRIAAYWACFFATFGLVAAIAI